MEELDYSVSDYERRTIADLEQREWEEDPTRDVPSSKRYEHDEYLGVVDIGGQMHAGFPSALRTLCQLEPSKATPFWSLSPHKEILHPTCSTCLRVVRRWMDEVVLGYAISGIPETWKAAYLKARVER